MVAGWAEQAGGVTAPFNFEWNNFPHQAGPHASGEERRHADDVRGLYHEPGARRERRERADESLAHANRIVAQGGDAGSAHHGHAPPPFQPYSIPAMRHDSAEQVRAVASGLRAAADAPGQAAAALRALQAITHRLNLVDERFAAVANQLGRAARAVQGAGLTAEQATRIRALAAQVDTQAAAIEGATTHAQREAVWRELVQTRQTAVRTLRDAPAVDSTLAATILVVLDHQVSETAPAYTSEQRRILESGAQDQFPEHTGPRGDLQTVRIDVGDPARATDPAWNGGRRSPAVTALIAESRRILNHPAEDPWWVPIVTDYATRFRAQLLTDIEARNQGYSVLRRPGEQLDHH